MQTMYRLADEGNPQSGLVLDDPVKGGYNEEDETDVLPRWRVAPEHARPWISFESDELIWPVPELHSLSNGVCLHGVFAFIAATAACHTFGRRCAGKWTSRNPLLKHNLQTDETSALRSYKE
jgi:hypothetical protein